MKMAFVEGLRREAQAGISGKCPVCDSTVIPKCGERRAHHWAHRGTRHCDHWWESETEWHRAWKNKFPADWQEIIHRAENGERHIADVKTSQGHIIEFQHSYLKPDERRSREAFYKPMFWVVDGLRRKRDKPSFYKTLLEGLRVNVQLLTFRVPPDECSILREWIDSRVSIFFDFGIIQQDIARFGAPVLWHLDRSSSDVVALLSPIPIEKFVEALNRGEPIKGFRNNTFTSVVQKPAVAKWRLIGTSWSPSGPPRRPQSFGQYRARRRRARTLPRF